jgi:uncharacterized protein YkwD
MFIYDLYKYPTDTILDETGPCRFCRAPIFRMLHWISPNIEYHGRRKNMNPDMKRLSGFILIACLVLALMTATVAAATTTGKIYVSSSPRGAQIWLDNVNTRLVTSSYVQNVPAGTHTVALKLEGYKDATRTVQVKAGSTAWVSNVQLVRITVPPPTPTKTPPPTPTVTPLPAGSQISSVEQAVFKYTNIARQSNGKPALVWDAKLAAAARAHSEDMATNKFFSHTSSNGRTPGQRLNAIGYYTWGENIAATGYYNLNSNPDAVGKALVDMWMGSEGHKANILGTSINFNRLGVGVAYNSQYYGYLATQDFARV